MPAEFDLDARLDDRVRTEWSRTSDAGLPSGPHTDDDCTGPCTFECTAGSNC